MQWGGALHGVTRAQFWFLDVDTANAKYCGFVCGQLSMPQLIWTCLAVFCAFTRERQGTIFCIILLLLLSLLIMLFLLFIYIMIIYHSVFGSNVSTVGC